MSWYKYSLDYVALIQSRIQNKQNGPMITPSQEPLQGPTQDKMRKTPGNLESALESVRVNEEQNPYLMNEIGQPIHTKATGQGADYLLQINKDLAVYRPDVFQEFDR